MFMEKQIKQIINAHKYYQNCKIFVGNINPETSDEDVRSNFMRFGEITLIDRKPSKDYLIIEYADHLSAKKAVEEMDRIMIDDWELKVEIAWAQIKKSSYGQTLNKLVEKGIVKNNASPDDQCYKCGDKGHHSVLCPNPYKRKKMYMQDKAQCFNCREYGHYKNKCTKPIVDRR
jgi:RNA recognition motif-containing protein